MQNDSAWMEPVLIEGPGSPADADLKSGAVHLWYYDVSGREILKNLAHPFMQPQDEAKAAGFLRPEPRSDFMIRRALLRRLLGLYTGLALFRNALEYSERGQPFMPADASGVRPLFFSVSHTGTDLLFALAKDQTAGTDIEEIRPRKDLPMIMRKACSPDEMNYIRNLPESQQPAAFYRIWTLKEAISKASGTGLTSDILHNPASGALHHYHFKLFGRLAGAVATFLPVQEFRWRTCLPEIMLCEGLPSRQ